MDHSYNNNNKWRLHAIFSDPRVWIKGGSTVDQHGSTWIKRLQPALQPAAVRPDSWLMCHASTLQTHGSCVRRPRFRLMAHASGVRLMAHASGVRRQASGVRRQASGVRRQASGVRRQASGVPRPSFSPFSRRPSPVMTTTQRRHFPMLLLLDLRPLSCTAWGNRVVLPTPYSSMGAIVRIKTGRGAQRSAAACCYSTKKGRHNAGPVPDCL